MQLLERIEKWPTLFVALAGVALVAVVGFIDLVTGYELSLAAFYILPIFILSWGAGRWGGIGGGIACAAARTLADYVSGKPYTSVLYMVWNSAMRLIIYVVIALLIAILK